MLPQPLDVYLSVHQAKETHDFILFYIIIKVVFCICFRYYCSFCQIEYVQLMLLHSAEIYLAFVNSEQYLIKLVCKMWGAGKKNLQFIVFDHYLRFPYSFSST